MLKVEVGDGLADALLQLRRAESDTGDAMRADATRAIDAVWVPKLTAAAATAQQRKLLVPGAGSIVGDLDFELHAANGPALSGGLDASHWYAVDYGMTPVQRAAPRRKATYKNRGRGVRMAAVIWVGRNLPTRNAAGRVVYPTIADVSQTIVAAWVHGLMGQLNTPLDVDDADEIGQVAGSWQ